MRIFLKDGYLTKDFIIDELEDKFSYLAEEYKKRLFINFATEELCFFGFNYKKEKEGYLKDYKDFIDALSEYGLVRDEVYNDLLKSTVRKKDSLLFIELSDDEYVHSHNENTYYLLGNDRKRLVYPQLLTDEEYQNILDIDQSSALFKKIPILFYNKRRKITLDDLRKVIIEEDQYIYYNKINLLTDFLFKFPHVEDTFDFEDILLNYILNNLLYDQDDIFELLDEYDDYLENGLLSSKLLRIFADSFYQYKFLLPENKKSIARSLFEKSADEGEEKYISYIAYAYYSGDELYPQDFFKAKEYLILLSEKGDKFAYNSLGYLYYYGRLGEVDYQKAFEYFSIAADYNIYEATYKLGDMYKNGYYVKKDVNRAKCLYNRYYDELLDNTLNGMMSKFADVGLRLATLAYDEGNYENAYIHILYAELSSELLIEESDFFGDHAVYRSILKMKDQILEKYKVNRKLYNSFFSYFLNNKNNYFSIKYDEKKSTLTIYPNKYNYLIFLKNNKLYLKDKILLKFTNPKFLFLDITNGTITKDINLASYENMLIFDNNHIEYEKITIK